MAKDDEKKGEKDAEKDDKKEAPEGEAEGEAKEGEGAEAEGEGKFGKKKKLIIIAVAGFILLAGAVGAGLFFTGVIGGHKGEEATEGEAAKKEAEKGAPVYFALGDILVNLSGEGKRPNYLKIKINLELADEKDVALMEAIKPRIIDNFQVYLRELRVEDLRGSAGLYRLREELLLRVTEAAQPVRVRDVLFQEMLVQ